MDLTLFNQFRESAGQNGILLYYTGEFSQNVVATIGDSLKKRLETTNASSSARRKVFSTFMEMAQNIVHYGQADGGTEGTFAVGRTGDERFFLVCGNPIRLEHVPHLQEKLEPLRRMTLDEIKLAYREQLRNDEHHEQNPGSKGAGLGFLTVAREASEPIDYRIVFNSGDRNGAESRAEFYLRATI